MTEFSQSIQSVQMPKFTDYTQFYQYIQSNQSTKFDKNLLYWNGTKFILNVEPSNIPNAGNGIFTYQDIPKETLIGYYQGELKKDDGSCVGDYSFSLNKQWYIDARAFPREYVAMINDSHGTKFKINCEFRMENEDSETGRKRKPHERKVTLWSIRNIKAGSELFADYGKDYWKCDRSVAH